MDPKPKPEFEAVARCAIQCDLCFTDPDMDLDRSTVDLPQPRWVGPRYWNSKQRVLFILLNPGSGDGCPGKANQRFRALLHAFRDGEGTLSAVLEHQRADIPNWGRGRFANFYQNGLGLDLDSVAFANMAWCATSQNRYPPKMLSRCFELHTSKLLKVLAPNVVVLSGDKTHSLKKRIASIQPQAKVIKTLHYAHRRGKAAEKAELDSLKSLVGL
jgi:hypothetical protein